MILISLIVPLIKMFIFSPKRIQNNKFNIFHFLKITLTVEVNKNRLKDYSVNILILQF